MLAKTAIIAITTSNSTRVNARIDKLLLKPFIKMKNCFQVQSRLEDNSNKCAHKMYELIYLMVTK
ncbi:MAG: hypothetical protein CMO51_00590 [Verrucomicrobiales bacterium]|nr:hypothetical protein [Verrucomicrobiales bacterium]